MVKLGGLIIIAIPPLQFIISQPGFQGLAFTTAATSRRQGLPGHQRLARSPLQLLLDEETQLLEAGLRVLQLDAEGQTDFQGLLEGGKRYGEMCCW